MGYNNDFLKEKMAKSPYTLNEIAERLGVSRISVWKWRNGKCSIKSKYISPLCEILNISINDLLD